MTTSQAEKDENLLKLVALCVKNHKTPAGNAFADVIINICTGKFGYNKRTARTYVESLLSSWRLDKWRSRIQNNPYLTEEDSLWMLQH